MEIRTIKNFKELESVRHNWERWQAHPNSDFEHFKLVCSIFSEVKYPYVVVAERDGEPVAILAARYEETQLSPSVGYLKLIRIPARIIVGIYQGMLGDIDEKTAEAIVGHLKSKLEDGEAEVVVLSHLYESSPLLSSLRKGSGWWCERNTEWAVHRMMNVSPKPGFILKNMKAKHRSWIRSREKKLNSRFLGEVGWRWINRFEDLPKLCSEIESVAKHTYQRGLGAGFVNNEDYRQRFELFAMRGQLRVQLLEIQDRVRAFWIGTVYKGVFYASETAYDPELRDFEIGTLGFLKTVDALAIEGVEKIDFGFGEAAYKARFGSQAWRETTVKIFAPSPKGFALKFIFWSIAAFDRGARKVLGKFGIEGRLKTAWRRRIALSRTV